MPGVTLDPIWLSTSYLSLGAHADHVKMPRVKVTSAGMMYTSHMWSQLKKDQKNGVELSAELASVEPKHLYRILLLRLLPLFICRVDLKYVP